MARAHASAVIDAPVETIWAILRGFNRLPRWNPAVVDSEIEEGRDQDSVGCIRSFHLGDGTHVRERLLALDDARHFMVYNFETPAFPVENYIARLQVMPVTDGDRSFCSWEATFDEAPEDKGKYVEIVSQHVFAGGFKALADLIASTNPTKPDGAVRWKAGPPNKVWTSAVIHAPVDAVWARMRDFAGMAAWHDDIQDMHMLDGVRSDKVSGTREFLFGSEPLHEELLHLDDLERSFSYRITKGGIPWVDYVSGARLWPITATNETFALWTGDWHTSPQNDLVLIPHVEANVYQKAFRTLNERFFGTAAKAG